MKRTLSMLLVLAMLLSCLPMGVLATEVETEPAETVAETVPETAEVIAETTEATEAAVEETEAAVVETAEVITDAEVIEEPVALASSDSLWQDEWGDWYFSDFEGLKILCSQTYEMDTYAYCNVSEALMILENLTIPSMLHVEIYDAPVTVPAGVSLTMEDGSSMMVRSMEVGGTADVFNLSVYESLNITGSVNCCESVWLADGATLSGRDKITFSREYAQITYMKAVTDTASLKAVLTVIENNTDPRVRYNLTFQGDVVINESVTLPTDCNIIMASESVTVASGAVLTVEGYLDISCPVTINGELVNNQRISLNVYDWSSAHLTIADAGKYSGNGVLVVQSDILTEPKEAVTGLNWADFEITEHNDWNHFWQIRNAAGLIKLATPTNLEWGTRHNIWSGWDEEKQEPIYTTEAFPGAMSWKPAEPTQGHAIIKVYRADDNTQVDFHSWRFGSTELPEWRSVESFAMSNPESGTYYFTVTAEGDYTQYRNSDPATSPTWTYVKPDAKLGICTNLSWDWPHASFTYNGDKTYYGGQEFQILFSATENGEPTTYSWSWGYDPSEILGVWDEVMMECGVGYYYFKVRALSSDITKCCNGEWSELSPAYNLTEVVENMSGQLNNILQGSENLTDEEVREAVQELDTQKLKDSLLAEDAVQQQIAILEEQVGGPAEVAVSNEVAMNANEISVVGANLNNAASADEDIKLVIDKPEKDHVLDAAFDNSVAFKFSMTLDNVADTQNLDVPVRITMPVPAGVNPEFLVILHYHADGTREEIGLGQYNISGNGDKLYVSFVVTSFSDFVITQTAAAHEHIEAIDAKVDATCTEPGKTEGKHCSVCNEVLVAQEEIPATDHKWDNGKVTKEPTATEDGVKTYTCANCGETKTEVIPATGAEIVWGDASGDGKVNAMDATRILRYVAKLIKEDKIDLIAADVNSDGRVNAMDATRILRYAAKLIAELKVQK